MSNIVSLKYRGAIDKDLGNFFEDFDEKIKDPSLDSLLQKFIDNLSLITSFPKKAGKVLGSINEKNTSKKCKEAFLQTLKKSTFKNESDVRKVIKQCIKAGNEEMAIEVLRCNHKKLEKASTEILLELAMEKKMHALAFKLLHYGASISLLTEKKLLKKEDLSQGKLIHDFILKAIEKKDEPLAINLCKLKLDDNNNIYSLDPNVIDSSKKSLLHHARDHKLKGLMAELIKSGAKVGAKDEEGHYIWSSKDFLPDGIVTELMMSFLEKGDQKTAIRFLEARSHSKTIDVNAKDKKGKILLHVACSKGLFEVCEKLLERKADPYVKDNNGFTAFDYVFSLVDEDKILESIGKKFPDLKVEKTYSEINARKWLAHLWKIEGKIGDTEIDYERFPRQLGSAKIEKSIKSFLSSKDCLKLVENNENLIKINFEVLKKSVNTISANLKRNPQKIIEDLKNGIPQVIFTGWKGHTTAAIFGRGDVLMLGNRGRQGTGEWNFGSGIRCYKMKDLKYLSDSIQTLQKGDDWEFFNVRIMQRLKLELPVFKFIKQKEQVIGNCVYASGCSAIYALFYDAALEAFPDDHKLASECAVMLYKEWVMYSKMKELRNYIDTSKNHDFFLLNAVLNKTTDLEKRKQNWKGKGSQVRQMLPNDGTSLRT